MQESVKIAGYLKTLDKSACKQYCIIKNLNFDNILSNQFETSSDVYDCLSSFYNEGISLHYLFNNVDIWGKYLYSITEERYHKSINLMLYTKNPANLILYFRACYRFGFPAIDDESFDVLEKLYIETFPSLEFLNNQTYDDDEYNNMIMDAIKMSGVKNSGKRISDSVQKMDIVNSSEYEDLNYEKSKSIRPVVSSEESFDFWVNAPVCRVNFSLKIDGINTKMLISDEESEGLTLALSRGRAANSIDYTDAIRNMFSMRENNDKMVSGRITGESFVGIDDLEIINSRYPDRDYKTPKSTAMAMLRSPDKFMVEDYNYLSFLAFDYNGEKPDKAFRKLESCGFQVPPYLEFNGEEIPRDSLDSFNEWMDKNVLLPLYNKGMELGIGSDGVVMYLLADIDTERKDKYSDSNIAIKYSYWSAKSYVSKVVDILFEQKRVESSIVLLIEPVVMRDKNVATRVGVGSPDILISDGVKIGDLIEFERKSEAYNVYLRKVSNI